MNWKTNISKMMDEHGTVRENGKPASDRTQDRIKQSFTTAFNLLHRNGLRVDAPWNMKHKHIEFLVQAWHKKGKTPKAMQTDLYALRVMLNRMGKPGLVKKLKDYLPNADPQSLKVTTVAKASRSWSEAGIDIKSKIAQADALDERFGLMLRLMLHFGLRRKEVLNCRPWVASAIPAWWQIFPSEGKGTRSRSVPILNDAQREAIEYVCQRIGKKEVMRWSHMKNGTPMSTKQAFDRFNRLMAQIQITKAEAGVSGHGLRAQYAENTALTTGFIPATLGGTKAGVDAEELYIHRAVASEALGHRRISITAAYHGTYGRNAPAFEVDFLKRSIDEGIRHMVETKTQNPTDPKYLEDCMKMIRILSHFNIEITVGQVQTLWQRFSDRHGCEWLKPGGGEGEIERGLQVASTMHLRRVKYDDESEKRWEEESKRLKSQKADALDPDKI